MNRVEEIAAVNRTPMRWPGVWKDAALLDLLGDKGINCLIFETNENLDEVRTQARQRGLAVFNREALPSDVAVIKGTWPGVRLVRASRGGERFTAGPTGDPWVDSNGWRIRLEAARQPGRSVWLDADPRKPWLFAESYLLGVADAATYGGRWIISLDETLAAGIVEQKAESFQTWRWLTSATRFFADRAAWNQYTPEAVLGVVSSFSGEDEPFSQELLNLVARTNQQYRIILKSTCRAESFRGLRALIYMDKEAPAADIRRQMLAFVQNGGLLITGQMWGAIPHAVSVAQEYPRYAVSQVGKGRIAMSKAGAPDPYLVAQDSNVLVSHRYDLLRFWNGGAVGSYMTATADERRVLVQVLFYAGARERRATVRVASRYRSARLSSFNQPEPTEIEAEVQADAIELHLPPVPQYAAIELEF